MNTAVDTSIWNAITQAGFIVQATLFLLILMSVTSWAIILAKGYQFHSLKQANLKFLNRFARAKTLEALVEEAEDLEEQSNLARIFKSAHEEYMRLAEERQAAGMTALNPTEALEREINRAMRNEVGALESRLTWLASTGSTAPFIGLFGTVWGLMNSFHKIGAMGSASLAVVAPGISEALVATAVGLFAAIPATLFYNQYVAKIRVAELEMSDLANDLITIMKRQIGG